MRRPRKTNTATSHCRYLTAALHYSFSVIRLPYYNGKHYTKHYAAPCCGNSSYISNTNCITQIFLFKVLDVPESFAKTWLFSSVSIWRILDSNGKFLKPSVALPGTKTWRNAIDSYIRQKKIPTETRVRRSELLKPGLKLLQNYFFDPLSQSYLHPFRPDPFPMLMSTL